MATLKKIKNNTGADKVYSGQVIAPGAYYQIQYIEEIIWTIDSVLQADIISGSAIVNDGTADLSVSDGLIHLACKNADCIADTHVDSSGIGDDKVLTYKTATNKIVYQKVTFGSNFTYAESLSNSATTSSSYQTKLILTTASVPAGDYIIEWFFLHGTDKTADAVSWRIYKDDTTVVCTASTQYTSVATADYTSISGFAKITLTAATHTFKIDHKCGGSAQTGSQIKEARLKLIRVS